MIRPAVLPDVLHIMQTMWTRGRQELSALDVNPVEWVEQWGQRIQRGDAVAFDHHAILGCDWESDHAICTSFQASESFEQDGNGSAVTKALRRHIPQLMKERGICLVCTYSLCVDPRAPDWFRLLGFSEDPDYTGPTFGAYTLRRFIRV